MRRKRSRLGALLGELCFLFMVAVAAWVLVTVLYMSTDTPVESSPFFNTFEEEVWVVTHVLLPASLVIALAVRIGIFVRDLRQRRKRKREEPHL